MHAEDGSWLGIMQKDKIVIFFKELRVTARRTKIGLTVRFGEIMRCPLQTVMDLLRDLEKSLIAGDCLPMCHQSEVI